MIRLSIFAFALLFLAACDQNSVAQSAQSIRAHVVASGLSHPWALAFLPDGRLLVTERDGYMRLIARDGKISPPVPGVPAVYSEGQGGLLDVALHPQFAKNRMVYFTYAEAGPNKTAGTAVARAKLLNDRLVDVQVIFRQQPKVRGGNHFGSRLVFAGDGTLFVGLGERFDYSDQAQTLDNHLGKVVRLNDDGSAPRDNPYVNTPGALPEIYSTGHRNIQGAALHPQTGALWIAEHGPRGGDEVNISQPGKNYGWPLVSFGSHYTGWPIPDTNAKRDDLVYPLHYWTPSIAPSGMAFYAGDKYANWQGSVLVGGLAAGNIRRLTFDGTRLVSEETLAAPTDQRVRDVRVGPDGYIYALTDATDGQVLRLLPQ